MQRDLDDPMQSSRSASDREFMSRRLGLRPVHAVPIRSAPVNPIGVRPAVRSALPSRKVASGPAAVTSVLLVCDDPLLGQSLRNAFASGTDETVETTVVASSDAAIAELNAPGPSTGAVVVVVESSDLERLTSIGAHVAEHPVQAFVTFGECGPGDSSVDPWGVGAHAHHSSADIDSGDLRRAIAHAATNTRLEAVERRLALLLSRSATAGELLAEQTRFDAVVARSGDLVMFFDPDGLITWASPTAQAVLGINSDDLVGMNGLELIHPDDLARVMGDLDRIPHLGDHVRTEYRTVSPDGDVRWIEQIVTNLIDEPSVAAIVGNLHDITSRKVAVEAVEFQARLLGAVGQAIAAFDTDGTVLYWNFAAEQMYGWTAAEAIGANVRTLVPIAAGWESQARQVLRTVDEGGSWAGVVWVRHKDGTAIPAFVADTPVYSDDGTHIATIGVSTDVGDRLRSEAAAAQLSSIVESSNDAIFSHDLDGNVTTWNRAAALLFGYEPDDIVGRPIRVLASPEKATLIDAVLERLSAGHTISESETLGRRADGTEVHLSVTMSPLRDIDGAVVGASTIVRDITERVEFDRQIEADRRRLAEAQASAGLGSFEIDLVASTITVSDEFWRIIGKTPNAEPFQDFGFVHVADLARVEEALGRVIAGESAVDCTHRIVRPTGEIRWVVTRTSKFRDSSDLVIAGTMLDITERRQAELATEHLAFHDPLTGLANRSKITSQLDEQLAVAQPGGQRIIVALVDLDGFKVINDSLGHAAGDAVLSALARRLETALDPDEVVARFGGDEFAVIRSGVTHVDECAALGARLLAALDAPITVDHRDFHLSMSVGIALSEPGDDAGRMFRDADTAMYHAKESGRARVAMFDESLQAASRRRLDLGAELQTALERNELAVVYQPVIDLATKRTSGFEALIRWTSPTFGPVSPDEFIPIAEETGLIIPIGEWVLHESLAQVAEWRRTSPASNQLWVAVNVSARQTESLGLVERVASALALADVPAAALHLELTESVLMDTIDSSIETMHAFHELGIKLSIDDFGTGYSSLSYLKRLPIDTLKIDRSFVDGLGANEADTSIVRAIISLAHTLRMGVLAEGVETETQFRALTDLGCSHAQGYRWSPGVPASEAAEWIGR